jgi:Trk K+ transport system NAD-binding subunit
MEKGAGAMIKMLSVVTVLVIVVLVGLLFAFDWNEDGFFKSMWDVASATLNAWFPSSEDGNIGYLILCGTGALFGILFTSVLIGIISNLIEEKIDELQKGNSPVIESGHFVVLGFTPGSYTLISEIIAGSNGEKCTVVVAEKTDKAQMHDLIENNLDIPKRVRLICKNIDITDKNELTFCSLDTCRSVVVSPMDNHRTIKIVLAAFNAMMNAPEESKIIASVTDDNYIIPKNKRIMIFQANDAIGRIVAHCCTRPGSALAFNELISFEGSEIYINPIDECVGLTFVEIIRCFTKGTPIGIKKGKKTLINPDAATVYEEGDSLIYIAETAPAYRIDKSAPASKVTFNGETLNSKHGRIVVFGDSEVVETIRDEIPEDAELILESLKSAPSSLHVENVIKNADSVVLLRDISVPPEDADINNIITLLKIRDIKKRYNLNLAITSVLYSEQSRNLINTKDPIDFVISSNTTSTILAQLAHNPSLYRIFSEFLSNFGSEIYTKSMRNLALIGQEMRVADLRENLLEKGYLLLGFFFDGKTIELNPDSDREICLTESDRLIVIADN